MPGPVRLNFPGFWQRARWKSWLDVSTRRRRVRERKDRREARLPDKSLPQAMLDVSQGFFPQNAGVILRRPFEKLWIGLPQKLNLAGSQALDSNGCVDVKEDDKI